MEKRPSCLQPCRVAKLHRASSSRPQRPARRGVRPIVFAALAALAALTGLLATACDTSPSTSTHGTLYLFASGLGSAGPSTTAYALSLSTGAPLWQFSLNGGVDGAARAGDTLYVGSAPKASGVPSTGTLTGLFASTGQVHWQMTVPSGRAVPLAASADSVYTQIVDTRSSPPQITLEQKRANDGTPLWSVAQSASASPFATLGDGALYLVTVTQATATASTSPAFALAAVRIGDGKPLWQLVLQSPPTPGSAPLLNGGVLYFTEYSSADPGQGSPPTSSIVAVRASDGRLLWHTTLPEAGVAGNVVVSDGLVCFGYASVTGSGGGLAALHAADGSLAWHVSTADVPPIGLAAGNGMLYAQDMGTSGQAPTASLHAYDASTGKTVFIRSLPTLPGQLVVPGGGPAPQVVGGVIYLIGGAWSASAKPRPITIVMALRANDGSLEWNRTIDGSPSGFFLIAP